MPLSRWWFAPLWIGASVLLSRVVLKKSFRVDGHLFKEFTDEIERGGLALRSGSTHTAWAATGTIEGVPVACEPETRKDRGKGSYTVFRVVAPSSGGRIAVHRVGSAPASELGSMAEVPLDASFDAKYRVFAENADDARASLAPEVRSAILSLEHVHSLESKDGALVVLVSGNVASGTSVVACARLVAALHLRRKLAGPFAPIVTDRSNPWDLAGCLPAVASFPLGAIGVAALAPLVSPFVCSEGTLRTIKQGRGFGFACGDERLFFLPWLVGYSMSFILLTLFLAGYAVLRAPPRPDRYARK